MSRLDDAAYVVVAVQSTTGRAGRTTASTQNIMLASGLWGNCWIPTSSKHTELWPETHQSPPCERGKPEQHILPPSENQQSFRNIFIWDVAAWVEWTSKFNTCAFSNWPFIQFLPVLFSLLLCSSLFYILILCGSHSSDDWIIDPELL